MHAVNFSDFKISLNLLFFVWVFHWAYDDDVSEIVESMDIFHIPPAGENCAGPHHVKKISKSQSGHWLMTFTAGIAGEGSGPSSWLFWILQDRQCKNSYWNIMISKRFLLHLQVAQLKRDELLMVINNTHVNYPHLLRCSHNACNLDEVDGIQGVRITGF